MQLWFGLNGRVCVGKEETAVQTAVQLEASKMGHRLLRNNIGAYEYAPGKWVHYGVGGKNWPDLIGYLQPGCRFFGCEVKKLGEEPTADQYNVLDSINNAGGVGIWVDSLEMFKMKLLERIAQG